MLAKTFILGAFVAIASAASSTGLTFTDVPDAIVDGEPQTLKFTTNDTSTPVTILLKQGPAKDLQTLQTLTTSATDGEYIWTPCSALPNGDDYALEISQGSVINYFGPFTVQGAKAGTCPGLMTGSATMSSSTSTSSSSSSSSSSTITMSSNLTMTSTTSSSASASTGTGILSNATLSSATLSRTTSAGSGTQTNAGAGFQGTATATPSGSGGDVTSSVSGSSFAFVLGAVAVMFLG